MEIHYTDTPSQLIGNTDTSDGVALSKSNCELICNGNIKAYGELDKILLCSIEYAISKTFNSTTILVIKGGSNLKLNPFYIRIRDDQKRIIGERLIIYPFGSSNFTTGFHSALDYSYTKYITISLLTWDNSKESSCYRKIQIPNVKYPTISKSLIKLDYNLKTETLSYVGSFKSPDTIFFLVNAQYGLVLGKNQNIQVTNIHKIIRNKFNKHDLDDTRIFVSELDDFVKIT